MTEILIYHRFMLLLRAQRSAKGGRLSPGERRLLLELEIETTADKRRRVDLKLRQRAMRRLWNAVASVWR